MIFFEELRYVEMCRVRDRIAVKNTRRNMRTYVSRLILCYRLAKRKYSNIGWKQALGRYAWDRGLGQIHEEVTV